MTTLSQIKAAARQAARELLTEKGVSRAPVPVDRIAKNMGINVRYTPFDDGLSGMAFIRDDQRVIAVNALHHPNRQRFTLAHELAHHVLHDEKLRGGDIHVDKVILHRDDLAAKGTDRDEIAANAFASEFLIPEFLLSQESRGEIDLLDEAALAALAKRFKVSMAALHFRIAALD